MSAPAHDAPAGRARRATRWAVRALVASASVYVLTFTPASLQTVRPVGAHGAGNVQTLGWATLATLDLRTGVPGAALQRAAGQRVRIPGYIVPLDDGLDEVEEFLLVPYVGACIHVPPPPANQLVYVRMPRDRPVPMEWWVPEWVEGTLTVSRVDSPYGAAGFVLDGTAVMHYDAR